MTVQCGNPSINLHLLIQTQPEIKAPNQKPRGILDSTPLFPSHAKSNQPASTILPSFHPTSSSLFQVSVCLLLVLDRSLLPNCFLVLLLSNSIHKCQILSNSHLDCKTDKVTSCLALLNSFSLHLRLKILNMAYRSFQALPLPTISVAPTTIPVSNFLP